MEEYTILKLREHPELVDAAGEWFHQKWGIPKEAYIESMEACLRQSAPVPQWYTVMAGSCIVAGLGVIENDFHDRKDLTPNVCAVYVEESCRGRGIAGRMLQFLCADLRAQGIGALYLITDHTSFYERYGWEYWCMVQGDGEKTKTRMYRYQL